MKAFFVSAIALSALLITGSPASAWNSVTRVRSVQRVRVAPVQRVVQVQRVRQVVQVQKVVNVQRVVAVRQAVVVREAFIAAAVVPVVAVQVHPVCAYPVTYASPFYAPPDSGRLERQIDKLTEAVAQLQVQVQALRQPQKLP